MTKLLRAAGEALQALTNQPTAKEGQVPPSDTEARAAFETATSRYFSLLSSVDVNIRRQIWALEEANIIAPAPSEKDKDGSVAKEKTAADAASLGNLDVGWLNSRNDKVGKEMEAELWEKARSLMAGAVSRKEATMIRSQKRQ